MKRIILLGAGFSKAWGGRLASEVWADVFTNERVQDRERVREALLKERSFEVVMEDVLTSFAYDDMDRKAIISSVVSTFKRMDCLFIHTTEVACSISINYATLQYLLAKFRGGSIFTLNQDTILERFLQNKLPFETPYVQDFAASTISDARPVTPFAPASGKIRVVKLHGSHTWINKEGVPIMVIGTNKSKTIAGSWLLTEYKNMFEEALNSGSVRLLVMGYSFKDAHVNKAISTAAASHQCRVFVWNPDHPLDMLKGERTICNGLMGWEPRSIVDVMPSAGGISIADEGVFSEFFG